MVRGLDGGQKPALIISEMQRAMVDRAIEDRELSRQVEQRNCIANIATLADSFRAAGAPVIHCTLVPHREYEGFPVNCALWANMTRKRILRAGEPGADIVEGLTPQPGDIVSQRQAGLTGFHATELDRILRSLGVSTVVLAGVSTNIALMGLSIEAVNRLYNVVIANDCVAGGDVEGHEVNLRLHLRLLATITPSEKVAEILDARPWLTT
jgi:nicotinamidase-related amidase